MAKAQWYLALTQADGQVGISLTRAVDDIDAIRLTTTWSVDASGSLIAECLHDLADELRDATASAE